MNLESNITTKAPSTSEEYAKTYSIRHDCENCYKETMLYIRKGVSKKALSYRCPNCDIINYLP